MSSTAFDLEERLKRYWLEGRSQDQAGQIIQLALSEPPASAKQAWRALQVMETVEEHLSPRLRGLIAGFRDHVAVLRRRLGQVDAIGNTDTEPTAALFEVLGEESEALELEGFDPTRLHQARLGARSRADAANALLETVRMSEVLDRMFDTALMALRSGSLVRSSMRMGASRVTPRRSPHAGGMPERRRARHDRR